MYSRDLSTKVRSAFRTRNLRGEYWGGNGFYGCLLYTSVKEEVRKARDRYIEMGVAAGFEVAPITWTQKRKGCLLYTSPVRYASGWSKGHPRMQNRAL